MPAIETLDQLIDCAMQSNALGDTGIAMEALNKILQVFPDHRRARIERGLLHLKSGDFKAGASDLDYLYRGVLPSQAGIFANLRGESSPLTGKRIIVTSDAGLGDLLQLVRYGVVLKRLGAHVAVECHPISHGLFRNSPWIDQTIFPQPATFDYGQLGFSHRVPMCNLIGAFGTTLESIPSFASYLKPSDAKGAAWRERLSDCGKVRIGINWRSANENSSIWTSHRSIDLQALVGAFDPRYHTLICLQKELDAAEVDFLKRNPWIVVPEPGLQDLEDTAAVISCLDLVVSTCTMIPHLSGALGVPTWVLLSTNACWRWMSHGNRSPWYPSVALLRQQSLDDWTPVLAQLREKLALESVRHGLSAAEAFVREDLVEGAVSFA